MHMALKNEVMQFAPYNSMENCHSCVASGHLTCAFSVIVYSELFVFVMSFFFFNFKKSENFLLHSFVFNGLSRCMVYESVVT